jgi:hypothetical protein
MTSTSHVVDNGRGLRPRTAFVDERPFASYARRGGICRALRFIAKTSPPDSLRVTNSLALPKIRRQLSKLDVVSYIVLTR